eukprot:tig00020563_g11233.t1
MTCSCCRVNGACPGVVLYHCKPRVSVETNPKLGANDVDAAGNFTFAPYRGAWSLRLFDPTANGITAEFSREVPDSYLTNPSVAPGEILRTYFVGLTCAFEEWRPELEAGKLSPVFVSLEQGPGPLPRRPVPAGSEGRASALPAARAAQAALLAAGSDPAGDFAAGMLRVMNEAPNARKNAVRGAVAMCLHPGDGPEPQHIEKAHASRRRVCDSSPTRPSFLLKSAAKQIEELAWCLAHLSAFPEGAHAALPHAPALRKVIAKAAEGEGDPEAEALYSGHSWETPEDDVVTGAIGSAVAGCAAALLRLRAAYLDKVPALTATENKRVRGRDGLIVQGNTPPSYSPSPSPRVTAYPQTVANDVFKKRNYALASLLYGVGLASCPGSER